MSEAEPKGAARGARTRVKPMSAAEHEKLVGQIYDLFEGAELTCDDAQIVTLSLAISTWFMNGGGSHDQFMHLVSTAYRQAEGRLLRAVATHVDGAS